MKIHILLMVVALVATVSASAQVDKRDVRRGNRDYKKENFAEAEIEYRKGLIKDSLSVAANYNLASSLYRQNKSKEALDVLQNKSVKESAAGSEHAADYFYNLGDAAMAMEDWQTAVDAFQESLLRNPGDLNAKENYIYAKKKLEQQQQQQNNQNQDQNQDNQDQNQNQDNQNDQNKDQNKDQNEDQNKDGNDDQQDNQNNDQNQQQNQGQQPKITPQAAQQMLQAIQAKEKETQEKVKKEKAQALQSKQKERNW